MGSLDDFQLVCKPLIVCKVGDVRTGEEDYCSEKISDKFTQRIIKDASEQFKRTYKPKDAEIIWRNKKPNKFSSFFGDSKAFTVSLYHSNSDRYSDDLVVKTDEMQLQVPIIQIKAKMYALNGYLDCWLVKKPAPAEDKKPETMPADPATKKVSPAPAKPESRVEKIKQEAEQLEKQLEQIKKISKQLTTAQKKEVGQKIKQLENLLKQLKLRISKELEPPKTK